jgi:hypothetical protein
MSDWLQGVPVLWAEKPLDYRDQSGVQVTSGGCIAGVPGPACEFLPGGDGAAPAGEVPGGRNAARGCPRRAGPFVTTADGSGEGVRRHAGARIFELLPVQRE